MATIGVLQTEDYLEDAYQHFGSFDLITSFIRLSRGDVSVKVHDDRFDKEYTWKDLHACSELQLGLWCIKPTDSIVHKGLQYGVHVVVRPVACLLDFGVDFAMTTVKGIVVAHNLLFAIGSKILLPFRDARFRDVGNDFIYMLVGMGHCIDSISSILLTTVSIFLLYHFTGPKAGDLLSYYVKNLDTQKYEIVLDASRIKFLKNKCGWENVADEAIKSLATTYSWSNLLLGSTQLSYKERGGRYRVYAEFKESYDCGYATVTTFYKLNNGVKLPSFGN
ncbi:MAG: hypothetical protein S4CHLAM37_11120 [Chlamydiia bacterium]|nr:hypothetical protein [Chlamydiia bacterium]